MGFGIVYSTDYISDQVKGFCDADFGGADFVNTKRSRTRYVFQLGDGLIT